jgi:hypothetical protein
MLQRIHAKAVAVGQCDPVFVASRDVVQRGCAIVVDVAIANEISATHFRVRVIDVACPEIALASATVIFVALKFPWPDAVIGCLDRVG